MMKKNLYKKMLIIGIITIFIGTNILPAINAETNIENKETSTISLFAVGETWAKDKKIEIPTEEAEKIYNMFKELKQEITKDPYSKKTQDLRNKFATLLDEKGMLPKGVTKNKFNSLLSPPNINQPKSNTIFSRIYNLKKTINTPIFTKIIQILDEKYYKNEPPVEPQGTSATANFCTIASFGDGYTLPVIIPVRPRIGIAWEANYSQTYAGEVFSNKGFYASGPQYGSTLGFTGGGGTFAFPGFKFYVVVGYTWHVKVDAEHVDFFPPNYEPEISDLNPSNGEIDVPISLSEISFKISDPEGKPMDYKVTTYPDIGSGEGTNKPNGEYSIPVSNLDGSTTYTWTIQLSDDKNNIEKTYSFTTELEYPIISDPIPADGETWVSTDITELSFTINDPQHDPMDYTVETTPDIGSDTATDVGDGTYTCDISNLEYTTIYKWYINVTDGEHMTQKTYSFQTQPIMIFNPYNKGWIYRKNITINHTQVAGNLNNFPILISITDNDLKNKAQNDGDDILFMDGPDTAKRLFHEIEQYNSTTGQLIAWVNIESLSSITDTQICIYYGNTQCTNQQFPKKVWENNYIHVWHLGDTLKDSAGTDDGTNHGTDTITGKIGKARDFEQNEQDYIDLGDMTQPGDGELTTMTWEAWVKPKTSESCVIMSKYNTQGPDYNAYYIAFTYEGKFRNCVYQNIGVHTNSITNDIYAVEEQWVYLSSTFNLGGVNDIVPFIDGIEVADTQPSSNGNFMRDIPVTDDIGRCRPEAGTHYANSVIDEVRWSKIIRSDEWIETSYNTMNDTLSFFSVGPEESSP